ncbi:aminomethyl-transferring glycine dehydrogenase [Spelaeicoccus albus]|uniref:Glycine dehydrogenase (decarboxylating) n=1 Tax=Spelaeicoccus albus TaxID=1280376 RepID=A0A7Z0IIF8_9MICO|nr:aminomethyl-transferring glycine dehydrogenase [Spelaeicoccus albus]NYI68361.1 glycine dehydrogenase [Spelaeicoccus albus]
MTHDTETFAQFADRHIGLDDITTARVTEQIGFSDLDSFTDAVVPTRIRGDEGLDLPPAASEAEALAELRTIAGRNTVNTSFIGQGYYGTYTPAVIRRNVFENPAWYTAYTPYQPEISQGRLEALLNFQTAVADLSGLDIANASMLDEATAAAEAMTLLRRANRKAPADSVFVVDSDIFASTLAVIRTRAEALGIGLAVEDLSAGTIAHENYFGVLLQYPAASGTVTDPTPVIESAHEHGAGVAVAADLLALTLLTSPGEMGADVCIGNSQRFGVPMGYGGPHAGYMAVREGLQRSLPGRLVGVSEDNVGRPAYRLALQTREQHIRREKATSNICTAQVLLAVMAGLYAAYHGPAGLRRIAGLVHARAVRLAAGIAELGLTVTTPRFFDTIQLSAPGKATELADAAHDAGCLVFRADDDTVRVSTDETTSGADIDRLLGAFATVTKGKAHAADAGNDLEPDFDFGGLSRTSEYLSHPVFHVHRSETQMLRYLRTLADKDYALDRGMIPLGSCTMKLNAAAEMEPVSWPEFANLHPLAPAADTAGMVALIEQLEGWLAEITGYDTVTVQPNAGSQGELAGLLAIRAYHESRGDTDRTVCLIPASAHGTNAASAVMAGLKVSVVATDEFGNVDMDDLKSKIDEHHDRLAAIMITYPSTHGVFEETISDICDQVHGAGGQVYLDGANLNALMGLAKPGRFGGDVSHLNLHKTFCIPHGGGGPGVGPIGVREHLAPFLPGAGTVGPVSGARYGSASILPISWAYIRMMGPDGLKRSSQSAIAAANYVAGRLGSHYPLLYTGSDGHVAHECILDLRQITKETGITVDDVAKRLIDYGFHAPTMSFPVAGTLMVEPTESEDLGELDRFVDAMISIRAEISDVAKGAWRADDNPLTNAPHTAEAAIGQWTHPYERTLGVFPAGVNPSTKYWAPVGRIDGAYGDRNLVCSCPPVEDLAEV